MADENLFRIELILKSRHLGEVLAFVTGKALEVSTPQLVHNAEQRNGKLRQIGTERATELFAVWLKENKLVQTKLRAQNVRDFLQATGLSTNSYSHYLRAFVDAGLLRKRGEGTSSNYSVNPGKLEKLATAVKAEMKELETHAS